MERRITLRFYYEYYSTDSNNITTSQWVLAGNTIRQDYGAHKIEAVIIDTDGTTEIPIALNNITITSFDTAAIIQKKSDGYYLIPMREGSAYLRAYYNKTGDDSIVEDTEIVVYGSFFSENYTKFFSSYDIGVIESNKKLQGLFYTCMEFFDILHAYAKEAMYNSDPVNVKWRFLSSLGETYGFDRFVFPDGNDVNENLSERLYRELLNNLFDLLEIRGTPLAYELFFNAIGCDIDLLEFWYDDNSNLVEINPYNESASTYLTYDANGIQVESNVLTIDPRAKVSTAYAYNKNNKSNYVKPVITQKSGLAYTVSQQTIIRSYLEFLRPLHIKYLSESFGINITTKNDQLWAFGQDSIFSTQLNNTGIDFETGAVKTIYLRDNGTEYDLSSDSDRSAVFTANKVKIIPSKHGYKYLYRNTTGEEIITDGKNDYMSLIAPPNPGDVDYVVGVRGSWDYETGGLYAEHCPLLNDTGTLSWTHPVELSDIYQVMMRYSSPTLLATQEKYNRDTATAFSLTDSKFAIGYRYEIASLDESNGFSFYAYSRKVVKQATTGVLTVGDIFECGQIPASGFTNASTVYQVDFKGRRVLNRTNDEYTYAASMTNATPMKYDDGVMLMEGGFLSINLNSIKSNITDLQKKGYSSKNIKENIMNLFKIESETQYNSILSLI